MEGITNSTEQVKIPQGEIQKDGATEYLNNLLEQKNKESLSSMAPELRNVITEGNFKKYTKLKQTPDMQKWYNEEGNLTKIQEQKKALIQELGSNEDNLPTDKDGNTISPEDM